MMRYLGVLAICVAAGLAIARPSVAKADERADLIGKVCGDAAAMGDVGRALIQMAANGSADDRNWAATITRSVIDRKLSCDGSRSPLLSLKNRAIFEIADAALTLRGSPDPARRSAALRILERQASSLPEPLFDAAIRDETDPGLKAQIAAVAQGAALNSSDPAKRIAAIGRIAANPDRRALTPTEAATAAVPSREDLLAGLRATHALASLV